MDKKDKAKILYADDESINLTSFQLALREDFDVVTAMSGQEALEIYAKNQGIAIVVADQRMPGMTGIELLERILLIDPDPIRIILTGFPDTGDILAAINKGHVFSYLLKPWVLPDLLLSLKTALKFFMAGNERKALIQELEKRNDELANYAQALETTSAMLEMMLDKYRKNRREIEDDLIATMKGIVEPVISRMRDTCLDAVQKQYLDTLEKKINQVTSPMARHLSTCYQCNLTPTEIQIINWLTEGKSTKEITQLLNLSPRTIETHRYNIRKKLGIKDQKANLRSHILSLHESLGKMPGSST